MGPFLSTTINNLTPKIDLIFIDDNEKNKRNDD
jgi:hypothetical protein